MGSDVTIHQTAVPITGPDDARVATEDAIYDVLGVFGRGGMSQPVLLSSAGVLDLLDQLIERGEARQLSHSGFPSLYIAQAGSLTRYPRVKELPSDEWVVIEAWDKS